LIPRNANVLRISGIGCDVVSMLIIVSFRSTLRGSINRFHRQQAQ